MIFFLFSLPSQEQQIISHKHRLSLTHKILLFGYHTQHALFAMETNGRLQGPGYQVPLFHLLMQTAAKQKRMFFKKKRQWGCFYSLSQTSNIIHVDNRRLHVTLMESNSAVHRNIPVHVWEFQNSPCEILQRDVGLYEPNHHGNKARSAWVYIEELSWLQLRTCVLFLHLFSVVRFNSFTSVTLDGIIGFVWDFNLLGLFSACLKMLKR